MENCALGHNVYLSDKSSPKNCRKKPYWPPNWMCSGSRLHQQTTNLTISRISGCTASTDRSPSFKLSKVVIISPAWKQWGSQLVNWYAMLVGEWTNAVERWTVVKSICQSIKTNKKSVATAYHLEYGALTIDIRVFVVLLRCGNADLVHEKEVTMKFIMWIRHMTAQFNALTCSC